MALKRFSFKAGRKTSIGCLPYKGPLDDQMVLNSLQTIRRRTQTSPWISKENHRELNQKTK